MIFSELKREECDMIKEAITESTSDFDMSRMAELSHILRFWESNKEQYLYKLLGNKLLIHKTVSVNKCVDELSGLIDEHCFAWGSESGKFVDRFRNKIDELFPYAWFAATADRSMNTNLHGLFNSRTLAKNTIEQPFEILNPKTAKMFKVVKGMKVVKAIGAIAEMYDIDGFESFRLAHSLALNEKTLSGELYLSIHPLDYITASDNNCGWHSCMNWTDGGEYRRGTVEMMNSKSVLCAYMVPTSDPMFRIYGGEWTNKKWREFFIFSNDQLISGIKGYPYWNRDLEVEVINWIAELAMQNLGNSGYNEPRQLACHSSIDYEHTLTYDDVDINFFTEAMYNDFYSEHMLTIAKDLESQRIDFVYSGESECMCCGNIDEDFEDESSLMCECCCEDYSVYCAECGYRIHRDNAYYVDGSYYCEECYNELPHCMICGEAHHTDYLNEILVMTADEQHIYSEPVKVCSCCRNVYHTTLNKMTIRIQPTDANFSWVEWGMKKESFQRSFFVDDSAIPVAEAIDTDDISSRTWKIVPKQYVFA